MDINITVCDGCGVLLNLESIKASEENQEWKDRTLLMFDRVKNCPVCQYELVREYIDNS